MVGSEMFGAIDYVTAIQGHPRSLIFTPIDRVYATSYWLLIVTLVLSCTISENQHLAANCYFLQGVSIACYAEPCISYDRNICLPVCLSVCHLLLLCQNDASWDHEIFTDG